ncbi:1-phosphofructokinase family hexose kinase [Streptomyces tsukubensis]|uniref:1-phosphofructokinase n=1 Tax=Streptomyces tsukubensis TaxID=83656 RepID=A0A1V4A8R3_9ACTN|nr:1-phosphofructokinase family hexose kinase [Streptomyces tsukubensis]OON78754.1 1-phosphofructokinase [Streptomyces tsukubensis]QFR94231.1 hexose kinase [Streptomyces tsukubensis]
MILTVTLNTALDLTYRVPALTRRGSHRVDEVTERAGGKGLNVARVLATLGHEVTVTGFAGGATGGTVRTLLAESKGVRDALMPVAGSTRRTVAVVDESDGDTTQFNEPGPLITGDEWAAFLDSYESLLDGADAVALSGSLPRGLPVGAYATLIRQARANRVPVLLDTSGEPLRRGVAARPDLVKPNAEELAQLTGVREPERATLDARGKGARAVIASLGADGLLAATEEGTWRVAAPRRIRGNPTGAGDSLVAGLLSGLVEGIPWPSRLARATALSAATVLAPVAGEFDPALYAELLPRVEVTDHPDAP